MDVDSLVSSGDHPVGVPSSDAFDEAEVLATLGDGINCSLLAAMTDTPRSVADLAEAFQKSQSTIYRHVEMLHNQGLIVEGTELDRNGHHRSVYRTAVDRVEVRFKEGTVSVVIRQRADAIERFALLWTQMRGEK